MINELGLALGRQVLEMTHLRDTKTLELFHLEWEKHGEVFGSADPRGPAAYFTSCLPYREGTGFLEMGCGIGVTAVMAALRGCNPVTALDINPAAVRNTKANARRHGVGDQVRAMRSDLFEALDPNERFDLIYWNSPFFEAPADALKTFDEYALFDPEYSMHRTFLHTALDHLTEQGRIFLGFSTAVGNLPLLQEIADEAGLLTTIYRQQVSAVFHEWIGTAPEFAAHADSRGMLQLDMTLLEFLKNPHFCHKS
jgi:release factor glutamine methyltransferase